MDIEKMNLDKIKDYNHDIDLSKGKINSLLKSMNDEKIGSIKEVINEINELIAERQALSKEIMGEISKIVSNVESSIMQKSGGGTETLKEQLELRKKQLDLDEMRMQEKLNCWRDISLLKRELRERLKEFRDQESNISMLDNILEGRSL